MRTATASICIGVALTGVLTLQGQQSASDRQSGLVRGNKPGEWRYWGADAWSTRYSPLDQINASNFGSLRIAWQWNAGTFGADEYYRTTPLYANGRLFTVATTRRIALAIDPEKGETLWMWRLNEGIRWQKAPRQFSGRGLAYWTDGREERVELRQRMAVPLLPEGRRRVRAGGVAADAHVHVGLFAARRLRRGVDAAGGGGRLHRRRRRLGCRQTHDEDETRKGAHEDQSGHERHRYRPPRGHSSRRGAGLSRWYPCILLRG